MNKSKVAKRLKTTGIILLVIALILGAIYGALYFIGYVSFVGMPISIKNGFSDELTEILKNDYDITITDKVTFIKGEYLTGIKGPHANILFEIEVDENTNVGNENQTMYKSAIYTVLSSEAYPGIGNENVYAEKHSEEYGYDFKNFMTRDGKYDNIDYSDTVYTTDIIDGKIICLFVTNYWPHDFVR